jgi:hypothetical protein
MDKDEKWNWRQIVKNLSLQYLQTVKLLGGIPGLQNHAVTMLRLDDNTLKLLMSLTPEEMEKLAAEAVPLFRLKLPDLKSIKDLYKKGNSEGAASLLRAGLMADCVREGES